MNNKNEISTIINDYCNSGSEFALMLNGSWGCGKTYFLKNQLKIGDTHKIIYTSANGIKTIDEIKRQILFGIKKASDKNFTLGLELTAELAINFFNQYDKTSHIGGIMNIIKKMFTVDSAINYNDKLIIIDDIERIDFTILKISDFLGILNRLFTSNKIKVLLVCDEDKLKNFPDSNYSNIKEKTIERTIKFDLNIEEFNNYYFNDQISANLNKYDFKFKNLDSIRTLINKLLNDSSETNLRTLIFFYNSLEKVISSISKQYNHIDSFLIVFTFVVSKGFKDGILIQKDIFENKFEVLINEAYNNGVFRPNNFIEAKSDDNNKNKLISELKSLITRHSLDYEPIWPIFEYVQKGYLNTQELNKVLNFLEKRYNYKTDWNDELSNFNNFRKFESFEALEFSFKKCMQYLNERRYNINAILNLAYSFYYLESIGIQWTISSTDFTNQVVNAIDSVNINELDNFRDKSEEFKKLTNSNSDCSAILEKYNSKLINMIEAQNQVNSAELFENLFNSLTEFSSQNWNNLIVCQNEINYDRLCNKMLDNLSYFSEFNIKLRDDWQIFKHQYQPKDFKEILNPLIEIIKSKSDLNSLQKFYLNELEQVLNEKMRNF